jgi:ABC-type antimicrobial peptide transport system ATPase subunit
MVFIIRRVIQSLVVVLVMSLIVFVGVHIVGDPGQIPGMTPALINLPPGCAFRSRCPRAAAACVEEPRLEEHAGRLVRCFYPMGA